MLTLSFLVRLYERKCLDFFLPTENLQVSKKDLVVYPFHYRRKRKVGEAVMQLNDFLSSKMKHFAPHRKEICCVSGTSLSSL